MNIFCEFINTISNRYECLKCGAVVYVEDNSPPIMPCSYIMNSLNSNNIAKHIDGISEDYGNINDSRASDDTIQNRFSICENCNFFNNSTCSICGCRITRTKEYLNKLSQKNEACPINKW